MPETDLRQVSKPPGIFNFIYFIDTGYFAGELEYYIDGTKHRCPSSLLSELLLAECLLRGAAQTRDRYIEELGTTGFMDGEEPQTTQQKALCNALEEIGAKYFMLETSLYLKEAAVSGWPLINLYDSVRKDPGWYLREELVKDCVARGGCCSRKCDCCVKRVKNLPRKGISGHCSFECFCCHKSKKSSPLPTYIQIMEDDYRIELDNALFLARMADAYFSNPKPPSTPVDASSSGSTTTKQLNHSKPGNEQEVNSMCNGTVEKGTKIGVSESDPPPYEGPEKSVFRWFNSPK